MQITRISTQGLRNYTRHRYWRYYYSYIDLYVMSYVLEYSNDGTNWTQYIRDADYDENAMVGNIKSLFSLFNFKISAHHLVKKA